MNTRSVRFPDHDLFNVTVEPDGAKVSVSEQTDAELTQTVLTGLKAKFPNIDEETLSAIMVEQRNLYINFLNEKFKTIEQK